MFPPGSKCKKCGKYHDTIIPYKGKHICVNCYHKKW